MLYVTPSDATCAKFGISKRNLRLPVQREFVLPGGIVPMALHKGETFALVECPGTKVLFVYIELQIAMEALGVCEQRVSEAIPSIFLSYEESCHVVVRESDESADVFLVFVDPHLGLGQHLARLVKIVAPKVCRNERVSFNVGIEPNVHHAVVFFGGEGANQGDERLKMKN